MAFSITPRELENYLIALLQTGVAGSSYDFYSWVRMEIVMKFKEEPDLLEDDVRNVLERFKTEGKLISGKFDAREYFLAEASSLEKKAISQDRYEVLGRLDYSPLPYVKTRLEYFLRRNAVSEDEIIDIAIATIEAVENCVKYGDGGLVEVEYSIDRNRNFSIAIVNTIKEFDLEEDIRRGKFSSTATLMRGMMVMQKLFDQVDLDILDDKKKASFRASRKLGA